MSKPDPEPLDIDAETRNVDWLHPKGQRNKGEETEKMTSTPSPNATVGSVHHSAPQGAITIRPRGSNLPGLAKPKRPKAEKLHDPVRKVQR